MVFIEESIYVKVNNKFYLKQYGVKIVKNKNIQKYDGPKMFLFADYLKEIYGGIPVTKLWTICPKTKKLNKF